jgi:hypothetical protein
MGVGGVPMLRFQEMGRLELPSLLEVVYNSSVEPSMMVRTDGDPLWGISMKTTPESLPLGERLRLPMQSAWNSRLPKRMVSPREKLQLVRCSPSVVMASVNE